MKGMLLDFARLGSDGRRKFRNVYGLRVLISRGNERARGLVIERYPFLKKCLRTFWENDLLVFCPYSDLGYKLIPIDRVNKN